MWLDEILIEIKKTRNHSCYVNHINESTNSEPSNVEEALKSQAWKDAMIEEYQSILKNNVWDIVPRPKDKSVASSRWLFKIKQALDDSFEKHKAKYVAREFS